MQRSLFCYCCFVWSVFLKTVKRAFHITKVFLQIQLLILHICFQSINLRSQTKPSKIIWAQSLRGSSIDNISLNLSITNPGRGKLACGNPMGKRRAETYPLIRHLDRSFLFYFVPFYFNTWQPETYLLDSGIPSRKITKSTSWLKNLSLFHLA